MNNQPRRAWATFGSSPRDYWAHSIYPRAHLAGFWQCRAIHEFFPRRHHFRLLRRFVARDSGHPPRRCRGGRFYHRAEILTCADQLRRPRRSFTLPAHKHHDQHPERVRPRAQRRIVADERRRADEQRRETEDRFRQMAENIHEIFWVADLGHTRILYVSPGYDHVWGRSSQSLYEQPRSWIESIHPSDRAAVIENLEDRRRGVFQ